MFLYTNKSIDGIVASQAGHDESHILKVMQLAGYKTLHLPRRLAVPLVKNKRVRSYCRQRIFHLSEEYLIKIFIKR